jgi:hypothetical protein
MPCLNLIVLSNAFQVPSFVSGLITQYQTMPVADWNSQIKNKFTAFLSQWFAYIVPMLKNISALSFHS